MPPRSRKRERETSAGKEKDSRRGRKAETATTKKAGQVQEEGTNGAAPDYSQQQVWDRRYRDGIFVEWYCGFDHVRPLFERFIPKDARVLDVGCGDKPLAWDLRDAGYSGNITGFDFSPTVIEKLSAEARSCDRKKLDVGVEFMVLDARDLPFEAGSFDLVVDKGTVDAMLCDSSGKDNARAICREAARVAAPGGWFVIVSHIHPSTIEGVELMTETLLPALQDAASVSEGQDETEAFFWTVDVHCGDVDDGEGDSEVDSDADGGGNGGGAGRHLGDRRGDDGGSGATEEVGPSAYMARKVTRRRTRSSAAGSQRAIPIRIHEY